MIIAIDGVAASGKSTAAVLLAQKLGFFYINSGLLYRAIAYIISKEYGQHYQDYLATLTPQLLDAFWVQHAIRYVFDGTVAKLLIDSVDSLTALKNPFIDTIVSSVAACHVVRQYVTEKQRILAAQHESTVIEGRDITSHVFPNAEFKFFITADIAVRAARWQEMQKKMGSSMTLPEAIALIKNRDFQDKTRVIGALTLTDDSIVIDTSDLTNPDQTAKKIFDIIVSKK